MDVFSVFERNAPFGAAALFIVFVLIAFKCRKNRTLFTGLVGLGCAGADFILLAALSGAPNPMHLLEAFQMGPLNAGYADFIEAVSSRKTAFRITFYIFAVLSPFICAGFLLSFFKTAYYEMRYFLKNRFCDVYIFSELNKNSLNLACDIKAKEKRAMIVFCRAQGGCNELMEKVYRNSFILLKKAETDFVKCTGRRRYFFALCSDHKKNFRIAQDLICAYQKIDFKQSRNPDKVKIFVLNTDILPELVMDSRPKELKNITVIFVNKSESAANELLFKKPLFLAAASQKGAEKSVNMLIAGTTPCADKILRLALSVSQMGGGWTARFTVCGRDASSYRENLMHDAPELFCGEYKIDFFDVDTQSSSFKNFLDEKCGGINYIAVALEDEDETVRTGLYLRSYFIRKNPAESEKPFIALYLPQDDGCKAESITAGCGEKYGFFSFGNEKSLFSYDLLVNSELEKLALNVHASCSWQSTKPLCVSETVSEFNRSETDRKSNRANAVHIKYKLNALGYGIKLKELSDDREISDSEKLTAQLLEKLSDKESLDALARIEHDRWNAHERSDGWISVSKEEAFAHKQKTGTHKFNTAKMHPCLCSWEELEELGRLICGDPEKYKEYDRRICKFLPDILGLRENKEINISRTEYILVRADKAEY